MSNFIVPFVWEKYNGEKSYTSERKLWAAIGAGLIEKCAHNLAFYRNRDCFVFETVPIVRLQWVLYFEQTLLFGNEAFNFREEIGAVLIMDFHSNWLGKIQAEDTHNGFCVNSVTARDEIYIEAVLRNSVDEALNVVNGIEYDNLFHLKNLLSN